MAGCLPSFGGWGLGFRVYRFRVWGLGYRVEGSGLRASFRVPGPEIEIGVSGDLSVADTRSQAAKKRKKAAYLILGT